MIRREMRRSGPSHRSVSAFAWFAILLTTAACTASPTHDVQTFAPTGLGAAVKVPASWRETTDSLGAGFDFEIADPAGHGAVLAMRAVANGSDVAGVAAAYRLFLTSTGAAIASQDSTSIEGYSTLVLHYSRLVSGGPREVMTEYDVIVGDGTVVRIAVGEPEPGSDTQLLAQITQSIRLGDLSTSVDLEKIAVTDAGFLGEYRVARDNPPKRRPAILLISGYGGGMPPQGIQLARAGYPTLSLAYYNLPTLPNVLANIPLEYFQGALRWLQEQRDVDPARIIVWGYSRGGEAALLLGATYPDLVHGVVANVPSNVVNGSSDVNGAAVWTADGKPLPFNDRFPKTDVVDAPDAEIRVEQIAGPVLLTCGEADEQWASCPMSHAIDSRLALHDDPYPRKLLDYPDRGHLVNMPPLSTLTDVRSGGDDAWRTTLAFLNSVGLGP